jgi:hypothetical protein
VAESAPTITRRQVLATGALALAATTAVAAGHVASWWDRDAAPGYEKLSPQEVKLVDALSDAMFPPGGTPALSGSEAGLARYFDGVLAAMDEPTNDLLRLLLHALDDWAFLEAGLPYAQLPLEARIDKLSVWVKHDSHHVRGAITGLLIFLGMGYCGHPDVKKAAGWIFPCGYER